MWVSPEIRIPCVFTAFLRERASVTSAQYGCGMASCAPASVGTLDAKPAGRFSPIAARQRLARAGAWSSLSTTPNITTRCFTLLGAKHKGRISCSLLHPTAPAQSHRARLEAAPSALDSQPLLLVAR